MLLPACSVEHSLTSTDNRQQLSTHFHRDSIYLHDSVSVTFHPVLSPSPCVGEEPCSIGRQGDVRRTIRGGLFDTLCIERWHTRWRDRNILQTDTVIRIETRTETIPVRYVPSFYKYCAAFSILFVLYLLVRLVLFMVKHRALFTHHCANH